jgi:hypothetical protein
LSVQVNAVGLVVEDALAQPQHGGRTGVGTEQGLDLAAAEMGVAVGIEQALLGDEQRALAIGVDRPTLADHRRAVPIEPLDLKDLARDGIVLIPGVVEPTPMSTPGVEHPVDAADLATIVHDAGRADITHPGIVAREFHDADGRRERSPCTVELAGRSTDRHRLETRDRGSDRGESLLCRLRLAPPVVGPTRPQHPTTAVRFELARHVEAVGGRFGGQGLGHADILAVWRGCDPVRGIVRGVLC